MDNTEDIRRALKAYMADQGLTAAGLGPQVGVSPSASIRWVNGKCKEIRPSHWAKLKPLLAPYLATPAPAPNVAARLTRLERALGQPKPAPNPYGGLPLHHVPVYGFANGAPSAGALTGDLVPDDESILERTATTNPRVIAAFQVVGQSMEPDGIYDGSLVLCERVDNARDLAPGAIVVANLDETLYCKHWRQFGTTILLTSSAPGGKDIELHDAEPLWVLRAVEVNRRL